MKKIISILAMMVVLLGVSSLSSCNNYDIEIDDSLRTAAVDEVLPSTSTAKGVEPGTEMSMTGLSLDKVTRITLGQNEVEFTSDGYMDIAFSVPFGEYQWPVPASYGGTRYQDTLRVYSFTQVEPVYKGVFYIDVPYTSPHATVSVKAGSVGDKLTIKGYFLDQVSSVMFGDKGATIADQDDNEIEVVIPEGEYFPGDNIVKLAMWYMNEDLEEFEFVIEEEFNIQLPSAGDTDITTGAIDEKLYVVGSNLDAISSLEFAGVECAISSLTDNKDTIFYQIPYGEFNVGEVDGTITAPLVGKYGTSSLTFVESFVLTVPVPALSSDVTAEQLTGAFGDAITLPGENLDLIESLTFSGVDCVISEKSATSITFTIPYGEYATPAVDNIVTDELMITYGGSTKSLATFALDAEIPAGALPTILGMTYTDQAGDGSAAAPFGVYLTGEVVLTGANLSSVVGITVGGHNVVINSSSDTELTFNVPDEFNTNAVETVDLAYTSPAGTTTYGTQIAIYPFYHTTNNTIGARDSGNRDCMTYVFEKNKVYHIDEWISEGIDAPSMKFPIGAKFGDGGPVGVVTAGNVLNKNLVSSADYYGVSPYLLLGGYSQDPAKIFAPGSSCGMLKNYSNSDGDKLPELVEGGSGFSGTTINYYRVLDSDDDYAVAFNNKTMTTQDNFTEAASSSSPAFGGDFNIGDVIAVEWISYTCGAKPSSIDDVIKVGFIKITGQQGCEIVNNNAATITFDVLWPKADRTGSVR